MRVQYLWRCAKCGESAWAVSKPKPCRHAKDIYQTTTSRVPATRLGLRRGSQLLEATGDPEMETR